MLFTIGIIAALVVLFFLAAIDVYWPIGAVLIVAGFVSVSIYSFPLWGWALANWWIFIAYFVIGLPWLFFRWTRFIEKDYHRQKQRVKDGYLVEKDIAVPTWANNKWKFSPYYCYWPVDIIVYLLNDVLRDIWNVVSKMVSETFDRYARWRFSKLGNSL